MKEEIGLRERDLNDLNLRYFALRNVGNELRINYYFFADLKPNAVINEKCSEGILEWVALDKVNDRKMPVTAQYVIKHYLEIGINTDELYSVSVDSKDNFSIASLS